MLLLALSTSTPLGSVALLRDGECVAFSHHRDEMMHAERLFGLIDEACDAIGITPADVQAVACDIGPGSFTGVRVGLASAKGIALGLGVPLLPAGSLEAMAAAAFEQADDEVAVVTPTIDAKRGELFLASYDRAGAQLSAPAYLRREQAAAELQRLAEDPRRRLCGAVLHQLELPASSCLRADHAELPRADWIARVALRGVATPPLLAAVVPHYVRSPDAKPLSEQRKS